MPSITDGSCSDAERAAPPLDRIYAGLPETIRPTGLCDCARYFAIPRHILALLEGRMGPIAVAMRICRAQVLWSARRRHGGRHDGHGHERRDRDVVARSCDLGVACSSPTSRVTWRRCAQRPFVSPAALDARGRVGSGRVACAPVFSRPLARVIERLLARRRRCMSAASRACRLPQACRPACMRTAAVRGDRPRSGTAGVRLGESAAVVPGAARANSRRRLAGAKRRPPAAPVVEMSRPVPAGRVRTRTSGAVRPPDTRASGRAGRGSRIESRGWSIYSTVWNARSCGRRGRQPLVAHGRAQASARGMRNGRRHCTSAH